MALDDLRGNWGDCAPAGRIFDSDVGQCGGLWRGPGGVFFDDGAILGDGVGKLGSGDGGSGDCGDQCGRELGERIWTVPDWIFERFNWEFSWRVDERCGFTIFGGSNCAAIESQPETIRVN